MNSTVKADAVGRFRNLGKGDTDEREKQPHCVIIGRCGISMDDDARDHRSARESQCCDRPAVHVEWFRKKVGHVNGLKLYVEWCEYYWRSQRVGSMASIGRASRSISVDEQFGSFAAALRTNSIAFAGRSIPWGSKFCTTWARSRRV